MRKVFIIENGGSQKKVAFEIDDNVKTLGDLIPMIGNNGINTDGMAFYESTSRVTLTDRASVLPDNPSVDGKLILMVSKAQKYIPNGILENAKRPEINAYVRDNNLAGSINDAFGRNWTNVSSTEIVNFVNSLANGSAKTTSEVYDAAVAYVEDCEDDDVRVYLLDLLKVTDKKSVLDEELESLDTEALFGWVK